MAWAGNGIGKTRLAVLTPRERQLALLMAQGLTNEEIAIAFGRSRSTIRHHVTGILVKLNVPTPAAAIEVARRPEGRSATHG